MQNDTIKLNFGVYGSVEFDVTKFVGFRPAFNLKLTNQNITDGPLLDPAILSDGVPVKNWTENNKYP